MKATLQRQSSQTCKMKIFCSVKMEFDIRVEKSTAEITYTLIALNEFYRVGMMPSIQNNPKRYISPSSLQDCTANKWKKQF
jgi:hypothetical protein